MPKWLCNRLSVARDLGNASLSLLSFCVLFKVILSPFIRQKTPFILEQFCWQFMSRPLKSNNNFFTYHFDFSIQYENSLRLFALNSKLYVFRVYVCLIQRGMHEGETFWRNWEVEIRIVSEEDKRS